MHFMLVAQIRPALCTDSSNRGRIEPTRIRLHAGGQSAAHGNSAGAALFQRRIVQECVGIGIQQFMRELRGRSGIDGDALDRPVRDAFKYALEPARSIASPSTSFITSRTRG